jgi:hypothetical protein
VEVVADPSWAEVALAGLNVLQVVLLTWIASDVRDAKHDRRRRIRHDDEDPPQLPNR